MLDIKKTLAKLLNNKPKFNAPQDITSALVNGWTCPADGLLYVCATGNAAATGYYITEQDTQIDVCALYDNTRYNNTNCTTIGIVRKGHVYKQRYFAGQKRTAYYYPLVMGGGST